jgi:hypothetical protein
VVPKVDPERQHLHAHAHCVTARETTVVKREGEQKWILFFWKTNKTLHSQTRYYN